MVTAIWIGGPYDGAEVSLTSPWFLVPVMEPPTFPIVSDDPTYPRYKVWEIVAKQTENGWRLYWSDRKLRHQ